MLISSWRIEFALTEAKSACADLEILEAKTLIFDKSRDC